MPNEIQTLGVIEEIKGLLHFIPYFLVGGGALYLSGLPTVKQNKYLFYSTLTVGFGIMGYGTYQYIKELTLKKRDTVPDPTDPGVPSDLWFDCEITDPSEGEVWSTLLPHWANTMISNPYDRQWGPVYAYFTIWNPEREIGEIKGPVEVRLMPNSSESLRWYLKFRGWYTGDWNCQLELYDHPKDQANAHLIGQSPVRHFKLEWIG